MGATKSWPLYLGMDEGCSGYIARPPARLRTNKRLTARRRHGQSRGKQKAAALPRSRCRAREACNLGENSRESIENPSHRRTPPHQLRFHQSRLLCGQDALSAHVPKTRTSHVLPLEVRADGYLFASHEVSDPRDLRTSSDKPFAEQERAKDSSGTRRPRPALCSADSGSQNQEAGRPTSRPAALVVLVDARRPRSLHLLQAYCEKQMTSNQRTLEHAELRSARWPRVASMPLSRDCQYPHAPQTMPLS